LVKIDFRLMRIALCLQYPITLRGGVSVLVETLLRELAARGHEIVLVSPDTDESLRGIEAGKWICQHIHFAPAQTSSTDSRNLARQIAAAKVDLAHFHSGGVYVWGGRFSLHSPVIYLHRLGVPCFSTVHLAVSLFEGYCGPQKPFWFKALMLPPAWLGKMRQLRHVRREITVSRHDFQKLRRWYFPFRKKFVQIYHSRLGREPEHPQNPERGPVILNVGHIAWRKGQIVLAEAFAQIAPRHPGWILQLAGYDADGDSVRQIRKLITERGLEGRIFLLGSRADAFDLMQRAAIYVQPSFWEALGLALQEAMLAGCACIGSRAGGIPELIQENKTGLLFEPGNAGQLARALEELIGDEARRNNFGRAAAASIQERGMTAEQMVGRHLELYEAATCS
jgi:glycosyltransferase involved in cell wall biosynthesis